MGDRRLPAYDPEYARVVDAVRCPQPYSEDGLTHYGVETPRCGSEKRTRVAAIWALVNCSACRDVGP
jgi:hypothetical protein